MKIPLNTEFAKLSFMPLEIYKSCKFLLACNTYKFQMYRSYITYQRP